MTTAAAEAWTIQRVLRWATSDFVHRGLDSARLDAELLLARATGLDRIQLIVQAERPLEAAELGRYRALIQRRRAGEPVAHLLGEREFYGLPIHVSSQVLIPRPDTETLVDVALARTRAACMYGRLLDLCTGSGCVAIAFAHGRSTWRVTGADISDAAIAMARRNAARCGTVWGVRFTAGDLFEPIGEERFDLVTANPPYVPTEEIARLDPGVRDFEPRLALDGGPDGLAVLRRIIDGAVGHLTPGGLLAVEVGHDQAENVAALFAAAGFVAIERARDYGGHERVVSAVHLRPSD
jgi:release factor glutamine methyltransferase